MFKVESVFSLEFLAGVLASAFEGSATSQWSCIQASLQPEKWKRPEGVSKYTADIYLLPLTGGAIVLRDIEDKSILRLDVHTIAQGLRLLPTKAPLMFGRFLANNGGWDAWDADRFVQLCLFGEEKYG